MSVPFYDQHSVSPRGRNVFASTEPAYLLPPGVNADFRGDAETVCLLKDAYVGAVGDWRPSVCVVSNEIIGPHKNGGIGTAMTGVAEHLANAGCRVTVLYTGGVWQPHLSLGEWKQRYAELGIEFVSLSIENMKGIGGPVTESGFGIPFLVYEYLKLTQFDVIHFNDCVGEGSVAIVAKKLGLAFSHTALVVGLHSPSQWVLEMNRMAPSSVLLSAFNYAERLSVKCADVVWSPSRYLVDWVKRRGFELPKHTFLQQYCLPSQRIANSGNGSANRPEIRYGRVQPPRTVVFFGRLEERKGLRLFCNAVHSLRDVLAGGNIAVAFLGKEGRCNGAASLQYIADRAKEWQFPIETITDLGQPEALKYLLSGNKLAVIASPADNSPCTVYESIALGVPFLASRTGGIPDIVHEAHREEVLFAPTSEDLRKSLQRVLEVGGWVARPAVSQEDLRQAWVGFHADTKRYVDAGRPRPSPVRVLAILDGSTRENIDLTLESLAAIDVIDRVVILNHSGADFTTPRAAFTIRNIDLTTEDAENLNADIQELSDEAVLMIHSGVRIRGASLKKMLAALEQVGIDGLQPAAEITTARATKVIPPLGGDPCFAFFQGMTFTGGVLVRAEALKRATPGRDFALECAFMGLADFCVTRGIEIWPYPEPVFELRAETSSVSWNSPARLQAFDECSATDRYYMLAAQVAAGGSNAAMASSPGRLRTVLALIDFGLMPLVRVASKVRTVFQNNRWARD